MKRKSSYPYDSSNSRNAHTSVLDFNYISYTTRTQSNRLMRRSDCDCTAVIKNIVIEHFGFYHP